ncbi:hypothetical protein KC901_03320 [Patescibacteria group bacterium]|nr:hypothetical protein [Patescibacteria group bacterium]
MINLIDTIKVPMNAEQLKRVQRIDAEDFFLVKIKAKKQLILEGKPSDEHTLEEGILALKQYYAVAVFDPKNPHAISDFVDPFWHAHILDTKRYKRFCLEAIGYFMDHQPNNPEDQEEMDYLQRAYCYTSDIYAQLYSYINYELTPAKPCSDNLICFHFGNSEPSKTAMFDFNPAMEPIVEHLAATC